MTNFSLKYFIMETLGKTGVCVVILNFFVLKLWERTHLLSFKKNSKKLTFPFSTGEKHVCVAGSGGEIEEGKNKMK